MTIQTNSARPTPPPKKSLAALRTMRNLYACATLMPLTTGAIVAFGVSLTADKLGVRPAKPLFT